MDQQDFDTHLVTLSVQQLATLYELAVVIDEIPDQDLTQIIAKHIQRKVQENLLLEDSEQKVNEGEEIGLENQISQMVTEIIFYHPSKRNSQPMVHTKRMNQIPEQEIPFLSETFQTYLTMTLFTNPENFDEETFLVKLLAFKVALLNNPQAKLALENIEALHANKDIDLLLMDSPMQSARVTTKNETAKIQDQQRKMLLQNIVASEPSHVNEFKSVLKEYQSMSIVSENELRDKIQDLKFALSLLEEKLPRPHQESTITLTTLVVPSSPLRKPEQIQKLREKGLQEIFNFYCRQHITAGVKFTFEDIQKEISRMTLADFFKFTHDFEIPLDKKVLNGIYLRKIKRENQTLEYANFQECLCEIFRLVHQKKIDKKIERKREMEKQLPTDEQMRANIKADDIIAKVQREIDLLKAPRNFLDDAHQFIKSDNREYYSQRMKGFIKPFGTLAKSNPQLFAQESHQSSQKHLHRSIVGSPSTRDVVDFNRKNPQRNGMRQKLLRQVVDKQQADDREKLKDTMIQQLRQKRELPNTSYTLDQLRNLQNHSVLMDDGEKLETILGLEEEPTSGFEYSFKDAASLVAQQQQNRQQMITSQPLAIQETLEVTEGPSKTNDYFQKMRIRAKEIESVSQSIERSKHESLYNQHMKRLSINKQIVQSYKDGNEIIRGGATVKYTAPGSSYQDAKIVNKSNRNNKLLSKSQL